MGSPWEVALGSDVELLHPRLRAYFGAIPAGSVGRGSGVFAAVGTPRRWLWPALAILGADDVVFAVWQHDVRFTIENQAVEGDLRASRTFEFANGSRTMVDRTSAPGGQLQDRLGRRGRVTAWLTTRVVDGGLELRSTRIWLAGIRVPRWCEPRLTLTERWDDAARCQRVSLVLEAPLIGRLYEYTGRFTYEIVES